MLRNVGGRLRVVEQMTARQTAEGGLHAAAAVGADLTAITVWEGLKEGRPASVCCSPRLKACRRRLNLARAVIGNHLVAVAVKVHNRNRSRRKARRTSFAVEREGDGCGTREQIGRFTGQPVRQRAAIRQT